MDRIRGEFIDIVEWTDDSRDTMVWRFPRYENEIKMGAKLIVRESQVAVFVNMGRIADVFAPGMYELQTGNLPILSTLKGWKHGFHSPFKAEVYFVTTRQFTDMKWGTQNPVTVRDPEFGMVRLRAFGGYAARVTDPAKLLAELAGTDPQFRTEEVEEYLRQLIVGRLGSLLGGSGIPMLDLAARQDELGNRLAKALTEELAASHGISIPKFVIENISLPPEVEQAIDARSRMGIIGNIDNYARMQAADAIGDAANNPGAAGQAMGIGLGMAAGQQMAAAFAPQGQPQQPQQFQPQQPSGAQAAGGGAVPPPLPGQQQYQWHVAVDGQQQGPYDHATFTGHIGSGAIRRGMLAWREGMASWLPVEEIPELASYFRATPPPLPPQA
ncbi:SPFH domain-containing protein [Streptomyces sp. NRRL F-4489]|uniref:SPFH domain-containing protein n=1 Tax=Streptomyces sp. NRRL F-4489 TaxID=1609095 RepID=UPI000B1DC047|nr:SPFH domain-containing protein [Streptomyces sp. NRRL F-4489]